MAVMSVLLVDNNEEFRKAVEQLLAEDSRVQLVGTAGSGREAIEMAARLNPYVVLIDLALPDLNGLQATRQLKAASATPYVIIMTNHSNQEYRIAAILAGADCIINKEEFYSSFQLSINWLIQHASPPQDPFAQNP